MIRLMGKYWGEVEAEDAITLSARPGALDLAVAKTAAANGIRGLEFLSGIPGSLGGATRTNAGCYGRELRDILISLHGLRRDGSKAAYRGAKLTKRVWSEIVEGGYVAQRFTPPSTRKVRLETDIVELKVDVRLYTYAGEILLRAARLYHGQATNMRTPGGGFSPILPMPDAPDSGFR